MQNGIKKPTPTTPEPALLSLIYYDLDQKALFTAGSSDRQKVQGTGKVYKSIDKGQTWKVVFNQSQNKIAHGMMKLNDSSLAYINDDGFARSYDGGNTFVQDSRKYDKMAMSAMYVNGTVYMAQYGGTYLRSKDNLKTVETINLNVPSISTMRAMGHGDGAIFLGVGLEGSRPEARIMKSVDGGSTFKMVYAAYGTDKGYTSIQGFKNLGGGVILASSERKILRSTNNGDSWQQVFDITNLNSTIVIVRTFVTAKNGTVYVAYDSSFSSPEDDMPEHNKNSQIWYSEDRGLTWQFHSRLSTKRCFHLAFDENEQNLFAATGEKGEVWTYK